MAFEVGSVVARIKADISDFKSGIDEAKAKGQQFRDKLDNVAEGSRMVAGALTVVGGALVAAGGFAIKSAAGLEQTRTAFQTMLKDGDATKKLMTEINAFAAETPFEFPELADAGKKLLAFGFAASDIVPNLRRLGDIASGLGIPIGELSELYGIARVQGRLYAEDINQLTGRGIPVIAAFAKQFNVAESEVKGMVESGKIGFPELQKAIEGMTNEGGQFAGGMINQSKTLNGMISTLQDNLGMFARDLVGISNDGTIAEGGLFARVKDGAEGLLNWMSANQGALKDGVMDFFNAIVDNAPVVIGILLGALLPALVAMGVSLWTALAPLLPFVAAGAALGLAFQELRKRGIDPVKVGMDLLKPVWEWMQGAFQTAQDVIGGVVGWFQQLWTNIGGLQGVLEALQPALDLFLQVWTIIWDILSSFIGFIMASFIPGIIQIFQYMQQFGLITTIFDLVKGAVGLLVAAWNVLSPAISSLVQVIITQLWPALMNLWQAIAPLLIPVLNTLMQILMVVGAVIGGVLIGAIWAAINVLKIIISIISGLVQVISFVVGVIAGIFAGVWTIITLPFSTAFNFIKALMSGQSIREALGSVVNGITGALGGVWDAITSPFKRAFDWVKGSVGDVVQRLKDLNPFQRHSPSLYDLVSRGTTAVQKEFEGMFDGIKNASFPVTGPQMTANAGFDPSAIAGAMPQQQPGGDTFQITVNGAMGMSKGAIREIGNTILEAVDEGRRARNQTPLLGGN